MVRNSKTERDEEAIPEEEYETLMAEMPCNNPEHEMNKFMLKPHKIVGIGKTDWFVEVTSPDGEVDMIPAVNEGAAVYMASVMGWMCVLYGKYIASVCYDRAPSLDEHLANLEAMTIKKKESNN